MRNVGHWITVSPPEWVQLMLTCLKIFLSLNTTFLKFGNLPSPFIDKSSRCDFHICNATVMDGSKIAIAIQSRKEVNCSFLPSIIWITRRNLKGILHISLVQFLLWKFAALLQYETFRTWPCTISINFVCNMDQFVWMFIRRFLFSELQNTFCCWQARYEIYQSQKIFPTSSTTLN